MVPKGPTRAAFLSVFTAPITYDCWTGIKAYSGEGDPHNSEQHFVQRFLAHSPPLAPFRKRTRLLSERRSTSVILGAKKLAKKQRKRTLAIVSSSTMKQKPRPDRNFRCVYSSMSRASHTTTTQQHRCGQPDLLFFSK
ncbi:unnamed protein product, partial [Ectocarpus sp. 12 AP-2014]